MLKNNFDVDKFKLQIQDGNSQLRESTAFEGDKKV